MTGHKSLIGATLLFIATLMAGTVLYPDSFLASFAATDSATMVVRSVIAGLLITLLVTNPPRSLALRTTIGAGSAVLTVLTTQLLFSYQLAPLDALLFIEVAIISGIEALETRTRIPVRQKDSPARKIPVLTN